MRMNTSTRCARIGTLLLVFLLTGAWQPETRAVAQRPERPLMNGLTTHRTVRGMPYEPAGHRIVFTTWHFIQPGDLDWRDAEGKSVYVDGNSDLFEATHVGINAPRGIRLVTEKPRIVGPFFRPHRMILRDGEIYKGWTDNEYFESSDGMTWNKKARLQLDEEIQDGIHHVMIDPVAPPAERYKAVWVGTINRAAFDAYRAHRPDAWEPRSVFLLGEQDQISCLRLSVSPDGIVWKTLPEPIVVEYCDTYNTLFYDRAERQYVLFTRQWSVGPQSERQAPELRNSWTGIGRRAIGRSASPDFEKFEPSETILEPTPDMLPSEQLYTNCYTTIPSAPDHHLMFPTIWNGSIDDTTRVAMAASDDGKVWHWSPGADLIRTGAFGQWNGGCVWALPDLIELPNGDWALPYMAHNVPHKYPRGKRIGGEGYAMWEKGRLSAVEATDRGEFTMIPFIPKGTKIKINALTERTGWVKVGLMGREGRSLADCKPVVGDSLWKTVEWKRGDQTGLGANEPVTLQIELKQAKLFGIQTE